MDTATFEAMRAGMDHRFGAWAVAMAVSVRRPGADAVSESKAAILRLIQEGELYAYRSAFGWGAEEPLSIAEVREALEDARQWRPRRIGYRRLVRFAATKTGMQHFCDGMFGSAEPIQRDLLHAYERLELQPVTCAEVMGMLIALIGFLVGGWLGAAIFGANPFALSEVSALQVFGMALGSIVGLVGAVTLWRLRYADRTSTVATDERFVADQYMQGPSLNPNDEFGDPRF